MRIKQKKFFGSWSLLPPRNEKYWNSSSRMTAQFQNLQNCSCFVKGLFFLYSRTWKGAKQATNIGQIHSLEMQGWLEWSEPSAWISNSQDILGLNPSSESYFKVARSDPLEQRLTQGMKIGKASVLNCRALSALRVRSIKEKIRRHWIS